MIENIYSIEQYEYLICKSNDSDQCYREYLEKSLTIGFGQIRDIEYEKVEFSKPSLIILSPLLEINENQIAKLTDILISLLENKNEYRKRYGIVHFDEYSYIIGGYIFDSIKKLRQIPEYDYKYNHKTESVEKIVSLPNMIVSFGLATGEKICNLLRRRTLKILFRWKIYYSNCWSYSFVNIIKKITNYL